MTLQRHQAWPLEQPQLRSHAGAWEREKSDSRDSRFNSHLTFKLANPRSWVAAKDGQNPAAKTYVPQLDNAGFRRPWLDPAYELIIRAR